MRPKVLLLVLALAAGCAAPRPLPRERLTFEADNSLFTLYAYLNTAGYDAEAPGMAWHPLRQKVRDALKDLPAANRLRYFQSQTPADPFVKVSLMTDYLFYLSPAPAFQKVRPSHWWGRGLGDHLSYLWRYKDLDQELRHFHQEPRLAELWTEAQAVYDAWTQQLRPRAEADIRRLEEQLNLSDPIPVTVMPNFLAQHFWSHTSTVPGQAFLMIGPQPHADWDAVNIRHEFLHPQIDPLVNRHRSLIASQVAQVFPLIEDTPAIRDHHYDRETLVEESLIRAIDAVVFGRERRQTLIDRQYREGFILMPAFAEALQSFVGSGDTLESFIPRVFQAWDADRAWEAWQKESQP